MGHDAEQRKSRPTCRQYVQVDQGLGSISAWPSVSGLSITPQKMWLGKETTCLSFMSFLSAAVHQSIIETWAVRFGGGLLQTDVKPNVLFLIAAINIAAQKSKIENHPTE